MMSDASSYLGGSLQDFVRSASDEPLPAGEDSLLAGRASRGDAAAADRLIRHHLRLVVDAAAKHRDAGVTMDDLVRCGLDGLMAAARDFDPDRHEGFTAFARRRVRAAIREAVFHH